MAGMRRLADDSIDCLVTDPPYKIIGGGQGKNTNTGGILNQNKKGAENGTFFKHNSIKFSEWLPEVFRVLKDQTHAYVMVNDRNMQDLLNVSTKAGFQLVNILAWKKNNATPNKFYMKNMEFIVMLRKGRQRYINHMGSKQCMEVPNIIGNKKHPSEKPSDLLKILIENSTNEGEIVLDPFMGVFSTAVASIETNRKYIGFEIDEEYFNLGQARIEETK